MIFSNWTKGFLACIGSAIAGLMLTTSAFAANPEQVDVEVTFVAAITVAEVNSLKFGLLDVAMGSLEEVVIDPDDTVTDNDTNVIGGVQEAADLTITATATAPINILIDNVSTGTGYSLTNWTCDYEGGADVACDGAGMDIASAVASGALRVGVTLLGDGSAAAGNQDGSFDVTVTYQ